MQLVLGSSCEEAGSTDGLSIAARHKLTHTHTHAQESLCKCALIFSYGGCFRLYSTDAHMMFSRFSTSSPLHCQRSHCHTGEISVGLHINDPNALFTPIIPGVTYHIITAHHSVSLSGMYSSAGPLHVCVCVGQCSWNVLYPGVIDVGST